MKLTKPIPAPKRLEVIWTAVAEWAKDSESPSTEAHVLLESWLFPSKLVVRIRTKEQAADFVEQLFKTLIEVFPGEGNEWSDYGKKCD